MSLLSNEEKELIFDYCFGLASESQSVQVRELISSNPEAAKFHSQLDNILKPLESLEPQSCPEHLAEGTIFRLNNLARSGRVGLEKLLADEQARRASAGAGFWRNLAEVAAVAAVIVLFAGVSIPRLRAARQMAWQKRCKLQLARIARGMTQYASEHDNNLPVVSMPAGSPWWKVGYQGKENHSNTRHLWLLVKGGYAEPADFVCPGRSEGRAVGLHRVHVKNLCDFPSRRNVTYSFRIIPDENTRQLTAGSKVLMADLSPVFEKIYSDSQTQLPSADEFATIRLCDKLLNANSRNHYRLGQNVMFSDGSVRFKKDRTVGISLDDIFTVKGKDFYRGREVPRSEDDVFLAP